jgi:hypothetical protein
VFFLRGLEYGRGGQDEDEEPHGGYQAWYSLQSYTYRGNIIDLRSGTSSIVHEKTHKPLLSILGLIVETAVRLRDEGHRVVIVSSGAIGVALQTMNLEKRPKHLPAVQVCLMELQVWWTLVDL